MSHDAREAIARAMFEACARRRESGLTWPPARELEQEWLDHAAAAIEVAATLSPDPVLLGEVRQAFDAFHRELGHRVIEYREYQDLYDLIAKLPKLTGEEV